MHSGHRLWFLCVAPNSAPHTAHRAMNFTDLTPRAFLPFARQSGHVLQLRRASLR